MHTVLGHCDLDLKTASILENRTRNISGTLFEVAISNFVCGCILMLEIVARFFWVIVTLTVDLICIKIVYEAYLLYYMIRTLK